MKFGIGVVALIILGAVYYFWQASHFETRGNTAPATRDVREPAPPRPPQKQIPSSAIMEDGTLPE